MVSVELISNYYLDTDGAINYLSSDPLGVVPPPRTVYASFPSFLFLFFFFASIPLSARLGSAPISELSVLFLPFNSNRASRRKRWNVVSPAEGRAQRVRPLLSPERKITAPRTDDWPFADFLPTPAPNLKEKIDGTRRRRAIELIASEKTPSMRVTVTLPTPPPLPRFSFNFRHFSRLFEGTFPLSSPPPPRLSFARDLPENLLWHGVLSREILFRCKESLTRQFLNHLYQSVCFNLSNSIFDVVRLNHAWSDKNRVIFFSESRRETKLYSVCRSSLKKSLRVSMIGYLSTSCQIIVRNWIFETKTLRESSPEKDVSILKIIAKSLQETGRKKKKERNYLDGSIAKI